MFLVLAVTIKNLENVQTNSAVDCINRGISTIFTDLLLAFHVCRTDIIIADSSPVQ